MQTCIIVSRTCIYISSKLGLVDQSKPCAQIYLQIIATCINLQLPLLILEKNFLDMHHHKTYMYINFQQNRSNRSVITVLTNVFRKKMQVV